MKKRIFSRILALVMAVSLLSTTAFAASFAELQGAINGKGGTVDAPEYYGREEGATEGGIAAWNQDGIRNVQLNEDVKYSENANRDQNKNIVIDAGGYKQQREKNVTIDLNGHNIDATGSDAKAVIQVSSLNYAYAQLPTYKVDLKLKDRTAHTDDATGKYISGKITGGNGGISVSGVAQLTIESGAISGNKSTGVNLGGPTVTDLGSILTINGGSIDNNGGNGISENGGNGRSTKENAAKITMTGGSIHDNNGHGVLLWNNPADHIAFEMSGGSISGNKTTATTGNDRHGGGVLVRNGIFKMSGGTIEGNTANDCGGGVYLEYNGSAARLEMSGDAKITGNKALHGGGIAVWGGKLEKTGGEISQNTATVAGGGVAIGSGTFDNQSGELSNNTAPVGKDTAVAAIPANGTAVYKVNNRIYTMGYKQIKLWEDENEKTHRSKEFTITVKDADGKELNQQAIIVLESEGYVMLGFDPDTVTFSVPAGSTVKNYLPTGSDYITERDGYLDRDGVYHENPAPVVPDPDEGDENPSDTDSTDTMIPDAVDTIADDTTDIEDEETPLAGLVSIAQLLEELRQYEGVEDAELPEDFQWIDHEFAQAIYWGLQEALVVDTEDDPLDPDEIVTVALMREVLENFVEYKGLTDFVVAVEGEDEDLVMDLGERLVVFYGELEAALEAKAA